MGKASKRLVQILTGTLGGISVGWGAKSYIKKDRQAKGFTIIQKMKDIDRKLYTDGQKRAEAIDSIKQAVQSDISK